MMKPPGVIALLTDFGPRDAYAAAMKGTILGIAPKASIVDISHEVGPQDIRQAGYLLWSAYKYFPEGTIFVCVVDPGVGSSRRIVCARAGGRTFLAPDNGLLTLVLREFPRAPVVEITNTRYFRRDVSDTFHGRDILAPVAAHCAAGASFRSLGPRCRPVLRTEDFVRIPGRLGAEAAFQGIVLHVDAFGNIITNFMVAEVPRRSLLKMGSRRVSTIASTYSEAEYRAPFLLRGSTGLLEISLKNRNAAKYLGVRTGQAVTLTRP